MLFGKSPFTVLPNGILVDRFAQPDPDARRRLRSEWKVPQDAVLLGHVGTVFPGRKTTGDCWNSLPPCTGEMLRRSWC